MTVPLDVVLPGPRRVLRLVVGLIVGLNVGNLLAVWIRLGPGEDALPLGSTLSNFLEFDNEVNLPTWVAVGLAIVAAGLCALHAQVEVDRRPRRSWRLLGVVLLLVSMDEATTLHEGLTGAREVVLPALTLVTFELIYVLAVVLLLAWDRGFLRRLPRRTAVALAAAALVYATGAAGLEYLYFAILDRASPLVLAGLATVEETLELAGMATAVVALLAWLHDRLALRPVPRPRTPVEAARAPERTP